MEKSITSPDADDLNMIADLIVEASELVGRNMPLFSFGNTKALNAVSEAIDKFQDTDLTDTELKEKAELLGTYWGELFCSKNKWCWGLLTENNESAPALIIAPVNQCYVIYPRELVYQMMVDLEKGNTSKLLYNSINSFPPATDGEMVELW